MTSIACWPGVDSRGQTSLYMAADSRITWPDGRYLDDQQKTFVSATTPDTFAFCGSVLVPQQILREIEVNGLSTALSAHQRHQELVLRLRAAVTAQPAIQVQPFSVLHGSRDGWNMGATFSLWRIDWALPTGLVDIAETLPARSVLAISVGSGRGAISHHQQRWMSSDAGGTSRAVFSAFCDAVEKGTDPMSGGAPQLVALVRSRPAEHIGIIIKATGYVRGTAAVLGRTAQIPEVWRNHLFERCDPVTMHVLTDAQRHARPKLK